MNFDVLLLILRIVIGVLFVGHGAQKLFGWFGGRGISGHVELVSSLEIEPAHIWARVSAFGEFFGGLLLILGLFTPIAAAAVFVSMLVAIIKVHWPNGVWVTDGGFEYALVLMTNALLIGFIGPGLYALDRTINLTWPHAVVFVISILVGSAAAIFTIASTPAEEPEQTRTTQSS